MNPKEIKKPEKKEQHKNSWRWGNYKIVLGYNQACDDWEKFLPSVDELEKIIDKYGTSKLQTRTIRMLIATIISKRIRGEK